MSAVFVIQVPDDASVETILHEAAALKDGAGDALHLILYITDASQLPRVLPSTAQLSTASAQVRTDEEGRRKADQIVIDNAIGLCKEARHLRLSVNILYVERLLHANDAATSAKATSSPTHPPLREEETYVGPLRRLRVSATPAHSRSIESGHLNDPIFEELPSS